MTGSKTILMIIILTFAVVGTGQTVRKKGDKGRQQQIDWKFSLQSALEESERTKKPIMVDFWATWCAPCRAMDKRTYTHPSIIALAKKFIMVKIEIEKNPEVAQHYQVETPPKVVFLKSDGSVIESFIGFRNATSTAKSMKLAFSNLQK